MCLVRGRPVIDFILDRAASAGCDEVRVVTRPSKTDVVKHVATRGATAILGEPRTVCESIALGLAGVPDEATLLIGFPDTLWEPLDGFVRLLDTLTSELEAVLGLFRCAEPERSDVVVTDASGRVRQVIVKPPEAPADLIWGCAVVRASAAARIRDFDEPGRFFHDLARSGRVGGVHLSDRWLDVGTPDALRRAQRFALTT